MLPGVSVSIVSDQKEIYSATFGVDGKTQSDYVLGNLTQSMTALGVLSLAEDGEIKLEDDITTYLPKYSALKGETDRKIAVPSDHGDQKRNDVRSGERRPRAKKAFIGMHM